MERSPSTNGGPVLAQEIRAQLDRVLASGDFDASQRNRAFLRFVVSETLEGREAEIKAYAVAREVFGRREGFDAVNDPIVRIEAGKLRKALERYYLTDGTCDPIRIDIPKGRYVPIFISQPSNAPAGDTGKGPLPSVAVLPFVMLGEEASGSRFADALSNELEASLSTYRNVIVASSASDARFKIEGVVRRAADRVRITVQLSDQESARKLWGETFDRELTADKLFDVEHEIIRRIVERVAGIYGGALPTAILKESRDQGHDRLTWYESILRVHQYNQAFTAEAHAEAYAALQEAVRLDPESPDVWAALAESQLDSYSIGGVDDPDILSKVLANTRRALALDPECVQARFVAAMAYLFRQDRLGAVSEAEAILAGSSSPASQAWAGWIFALVGDWDRGLPILTESLEALEAFPSWLHHAPFLWHYAHQRYEEALEQAMRFSMPGLFWDPLDKAAVLGQLGRIDEARVEIDKMLSLQPKIAAEPRRYLSCFVFGDELVDQMLDGLQRAGLRS